MYKWLKKVLALAGVGMLMCAALLAAYYYWEDQCAAENSERLLQELQAQIETGVVEEKEQERPVPETFHHGADTKDIEESAVDEQTAEQDAEIAEQDEETVELPADLPEHALGILELPAQKIALPVLDAYSEDLLKQYPCSYGAEECGDGQLIIAGHNYKSHFRCLSAMQTGDTVVLTTMDGIRHTYEVSEIIEISGNDREALFAGTWDLTLFTCAAYRKNRVVVRCLLKGDLT